MVIIVRIDTKLIASIKISGRDATLPPITFEDEVNVTSSTGVIYRLVEV